MIRKSVCLSVLILFFISSLAMAKNFEVATGEWAPYVSESMSGGGPTGLIITAAIEATGHTVTFKYMPWSRTEGLTQKGKIVATFPWSISDDFKTTTFQSTPLAHQQMVFFYLKEKHPGWDYTGFDELKKLKVGGSLGYTYVDMFKEAGIKAVYVDDNIKSFKMLIHGRVDVVPESKLVGMQTLKDNYAADADKVAFSATPLFVKPLYLMVSKTHPDGPELIEAFEKGFKIIRENGTYKKLLDEYGLSE